MSNSFAKWNEMSFSKDKRVKQFRNDLIEKARNVRLKEQQNRRNMDIQEESLKELIKKDFENFKRQEAYLDLDTDENDFLQILEDSISSELSHHRVYSQVEFEESLCNELVENYFGGQVLCPVCQVNSLVQGDHVIYCSCGMKVDIYNDDIDLKYFKESVIESIDRHSQQCPCDVEYENMCELEVYILYVKCRVCKFKESAI